MPLTYYYHPLAFNPAKPSLVIAEKRIPCKQVGIDLFSGQSLDPWFMKINPKSWVPVLDTGDKVRATMRHVCSCCRVCQQPMMQCTMRYT